METDYLLDKDFLYRLHLTKNRKSRIRLISLTKEGYPIEEITGLVTDGSVSVDGDSALRRTCSLSLVSNDKINDYNWALKTKFKVFIGLKNDIDDKYPEIIWFPQGTFTITSFSKSESLNSLTISIQGKDKMSLLNGDMGGIIDAPSVRFDAIEEEDGSFTKYTIKDIITDLLQTYAYEQPQNIIIKDLELYGVELLEYRKNEPLFLILDENDSVLQSDPAGSATVYYQNSSGNIESNILKELIGKAGFNFDTRVNLNVETQTIYPTEVGFFPDGPFKYTVAKINYGETAGYRLTDLTYPKELIGQSGETVVSVLDKIVNMLGDFEYFYDVYGNFIFQRKRFYINTHWNNLSSLNGDYKDTFVLPSSQVSETFLDLGGKELIVSISETPDIANIKNDFSIHGERTGISGASIPIHMRFAIDEKPTLYNTIQVNKEDVEPINELYGLNMPTQSSKSFSSKDYDWRELIYQMAIDFRAYNKLDNFYQKVAEANPQFSTGITGYEQYYIDMQGFWRQLSNEDGKIKSEVLENPSVLNFWFDFLDTEGELKKYSIKEIGRRPLVIKDNEVKSIYFKETPRVIYTNNIRDRNKKTGYSYFLINGIDSLFSISSQKKSAQEALDEQLYKYACCTETVSITTFPIYYLEPNVKILFNGEKYKLSKFTLPFGYGGTMQLSLVKEIDSLY